MKLRQKLKALPFIREYLKEIDIPMKEYEKSIDGGWNNYIIQHLNLDETPVLMITRFVTVRKVRDSS